MAIVSTLGRWPLYHFESLFWRGAIEKCPMPEDPIFIVGHWRSGTTHLHNLFSQDPRFGFIDFAQTSLPWNMLGKKARIGREIIRRTLPKTRGIDNVLLTPEAPQEEEMALGNMNPVCYYNGYYFPQQFRKQFRRSMFFDELTPEELDGFKDAYRLLVRKLNYAYGGKQLLLKNPASTTRILLLKELFPRARFIHIVRNPYKVYLSTMAHFARVLNAFAWQDFLDIDYHALTLDNYEDLMRRYLQDREQIPPGQLCETTFEAITKQPLEEIGRIYDSLGLENRDDALAAIAPYVESQKGYRKNIHTLRPAAAQDIQERWRFSLDHWGYPTDPTDDIQIAD